MASVVGRDRFEEVCWQSVSSPHGGRGALDRWGHYGGKLTGLCFLQVVDLELMVVLAAGGTTILIRARRPRLCRCPSCSARSGCPPMLKPARRSVSALHRLNLGGPSCHLQLFHSPTFRNYSHTSCGGGFQCCVCVLLEGEHVSVLRGDAGPSLGVRCSQRRLSVLGGKALPQHLSGGTICLTHAWKSHDPPGIQATHPQLCLCLSRVLVSDVWRKTRFMPLQMKVKQSVHFTFYTCPSNYMPTNLIQMQMFSDTIETY